MGYDDERWTEGAHHVGLTVPDLRAAERFFTDGLGYQRCGGVEDYPAVFLSDGATMLTLWQARDGEPAATFDRHHQLGLHHLAIRVRGGALDALHERLSARDDVEIEFAPEALGGGAIRHMMTRIPGGLRVEFIDPSAA